MRNVLSSLLAIVVITAVFGFGYPLVMTGFAQVAFSHQANGSLISVDGKVVGSKLAGQEFTSPKYFHERRLSPTTRPARASPTSARRTPTWRRT
jgi:K+-transporting ATPase ATPase C chain